MITATRSVHPGIGKFWIGGGRVVLLYGVASLAWLGSLNFAFGESSESNAAKDSAVSETPIEPSADAPQLDESPVARDDGTRDTAEAVAEKIGEPTVHRIGPVTT